VTTVAVLGAEGFVGSAFVAHLSREAGVELLPVTRTNYERATGRRYDVVVDCSGNSRKYVADEDPAGEFARSVAHRLRTLLDFPAGLQLHISSVDVYSDLTSPETTHEDASIDLGRSSHYGFHKLLAEELVQHYAPHWLILRLAGMVGPGLRKNPVYDILHGQPLRIHPDSRYQFLATADVARIGWELARREIRHEFVNVCGDGLVSPREIAAMAGRSLDLSLLGAEAAPRVVDASVEKLRRLLPVPTSRQTLARFLEGAA
jgi:nucleoside-diphosphate-sugar epimerase